MKKLILQTLFVSAILACASCSELDVSLSESQMTDAIQSRSLSTNLEYYYYYRGKKIPLKVHPTKRYVVVEEGGSESVKPLGFKEEQNSYYVNKTQRGYIVDVDTAQTIKVSSNLNTLNSLTQNDNIVAIEYVIGDSILTPVSNEFYVKLKKLSDISLLEKYAKAIGCELEGAIESDNYWICLTSNKNSMLNSLEASNFMYETGHFAKVDPGFLLKFEDFSTPSDPDYNLQWNMHSTYGIKANYAWNITKGSSDIIVAVLEGGIYTEHPDLVNRITDSYDAVNNSTPYIYTDHATKVAGVIASNHNDLFIAGVAPNVHLMNVYIGRSNSGERIPRNIAAGIKYAWENGADVINNSWGDDNDNPSSHSEVLEDAINDALNKGRDGNGCIVVFASGNSSIMSYPANSIDDILTVGEIDSFGFVTPKSGKGQELDVVAPGAGIYSLNSSGGISYITGTSFAAPHASGLAALILSLSPNLTQSQVNTIIKETASSKTWNSTQGYGRINAYNALKAVQGDYSIVNADYGNTAYAVAKFYIPDLPQSASVEWSTSSDKATIISTITRDTVVFKYDFTGQTLTDEIQATVTYCGMVSNHTLPVTITNAPKIFGVEQFELMSSADKKNFKISCSDPNATFIWECNNYSMTWIDFPFAGDAGFSDNPQIYKTLSIDGYIPSGSYPLSVTASNSYGWETYYFEYIHSHSN